MDCFGGLAYSGGGFSGHVFSWLLRECPGVCVWRALAEISVEIHGYFGYLYPWFS